MPLYGVNINGYVPDVRASGLSMGLKAKAPTAGSTKCNFCETVTEGLKAMECDRKSVVDGEMGCPLAYLFKKGLVTKWGLPTEKAENGKGL